MNTTPIVYHLTSSHAKEKEKKENKKKKKELTCFQDLNSKMAEVPLSGQGDSRRPLLRIRANSMTDEKRGSSKYTSLNSPIPDAMPEPVFIAAFAASQIVTNDHDLHADDWIVPDEIEPFVETALVSAGALQLVNRFLDQLLFSIITAARSTSLTALRPAIAEVLKPKLAKEAIAGADQELHDYLGTGDDAELLAFHNALEPSAGWDPEKVWKRTRLRCMVYSSLGDLEEDDEDQYLEQQELAQRSNRFSIPPFVVSPAVAIFLTSILEFIGEQALVYAGQHAYHRLRMKERKELSEGSGSTPPLEISNRVVVEEGDMEKLALDRTLGRLWRGWRKRLRSPITPSRSMSRDSCRSRRHSRSFSSVGRIPCDSQARRPSIQEVIDLAFAASIPLPMAEDYIQEIEVPGLAPSEDESAPDKNKKRPRSMMPFAAGNWQNVLLTPDESRPQTPVLPVAVSRKRSNSVPTPLPSPLTTLFPSQDEPSIGSALATHESGVKEWQVDRDGPAGSPTESRGEESEKSPAKSKGDYVWEDALTGVSNVEDMTGAAFTSEGTIFTNLNFADDSVPKYPPMSRDSDEPYYVVEIPKIMTSHRISMGALTPDSPISPSTSSRSLSLHSVKIIDVPWRSSPALRSPGSAEGTSPVARNPGSSLVRSMAGLSTRSDGNSGESIDEVAVSKSHEPAVKRLQGAAPESTLAAEIKVEELPPPRFVLAPAPMGGQRRLSNGVPKPDIPTRTNLLDLTTGVPPLTPLREMMESADDTSDEASSIAASNDSRSMSKDRPKVHTPNTSSGQSNQHRRPAPISENPHERTRKDSVSKISSEVVRRSNRSASQSSSATIQSNKVVKVMRTSSDYGDEAQGKSFDELIRSDQTIQYTLTPQSMRDTGLSSPVTKTIAVASAPPRSNPAKSIVNLNKVGPLQSNPAPESLKAKPFRPVPRLMTANNSSRPRGGVPQAREARVGLESIGDFADFIRSTGPTGLSRQPTQSASAGAQSSPTRGGGHPALTRYASVSTARAGHPAPLTRSESSAGRPRLVAREAIVPHSDNNSDLIDFIRQGPPSQHPRISRHVAPFRTTMDSDQMTGAVEGKALEQVLPDPRDSQMTSISDSMQSVTSQSALLNGANRPTVTPAQSNNNFDQQDTMPKRKTRRVKDPYAIDFSDEDDEIFALSSKKPMRQEESLIDFLNNVPPPTSTAPPEKSAKARTLMKKKSSKGIMSRFTRTNSTSSAASDLSPKYTDNSNVPRSSTYSSLATSAPQPPSSLPSSHVAEMLNSDSSAIRAPARSYNDTSGPRKSLPQFKQPDTSSPTSMSPPQYQSEKPKTYERARRNYVSHLDTERNPASTAGTTSNRVAQGNHQPMQAWLKATEEHDDLAAFMMASNPPPIPKNTACEPFVLNERASVTSGGSFSRMFRKKKAVGGYA